MPRKSSTCSTGVRRWAGSCRSAAPAAAPLPQPADATYDVVRKGSGKQQVATTMALVRIMKELLRDKEIGKRIVPIIPDEARTFGMDSWFPSLEDLQPQRAAVHRRSMRN